MRVLVVGYGSIGSRHARLLEEQGHDVHCVTRNDACPFPAHAGLEEGLTAFETGTAPSSPTRPRPISPPWRRSSARGSLGPILMEKPLFQTVPDSCPRFRTRCSRPTICRFHPLVGRLRGDASRTSRCTARGCTWASTCRTGGPEPTTPPGIRPAGPGAAACCATSPRAGPRPVAPRTMAPGDGAGRPFQRTGHRLGRRLRPAHGDRTLPGSHHKPELSFPTGPPGHRDQRQRRVRPGRPHRRDPGSQRRDGTFSRGARHHLRRPAGRILLGRTAHAVHLRRGAGRAPAHRGCGAANATRTWVEDK